MQEPVIIQGVVHRNGEDVGYGNNGKTKRQMVVKTDGQYPQEIPVMFMDEKCSRDLDAKPVGSQIKITANIKGRGWEKDGKESFFLELQGWKVE